MVANVYWNFIFSSFILLSCGSLFHIFRSVCLYACIVAFLSFFFFWITLWMCVEYGYTKHRRVTMTTQQLISNEKFLWMIAHAANTYGHTHTHTLTHTKTSIANTQANEKHFVEKAHITASKKKESLFDNSSTRVSRIHTHTHKCSTDRNLGEFLVFILVFVGFIGGWLNFNS